MPAINLDKAIDVPTEFPDREALLKQYPEAQLYETDCITGAGRRFEVWHVSVEQDSPLADELGLGDEDFIDEFDDETTPFFEVLIYKP